MSTDHLSLSLPLCVLSLSLSSPHSHLLYLSHSSFSLSVSLSLSLPPSLSFFLSISLLPVFQCRPHISWIHHVSTQSYAVAAAAAVDHGYRETKLPTAMTLLSIGKLSAMLASPAASTGPPSVPLPLPLHLSSSNCQDRRALKHVWVSSSDAAREASANLAVMNAQLMVMEGNKE